MSDYSLVVFDMAGTTVRDKGNVAEAFIRAFQKHGINIPTAEVNKVMGWRKKDAIRLLLDKYHPFSNGMDNELIETIHDAFISNMIAFYEQDDELQALDKAEELFAELKANDIKVALNTGFTRAITDVILKKLQWVPGKTIDFVIASDEVPQGRPHPYMINELMQQSGISDTRKVVKVGDTEVDVEEGRYAGCGLVVSVTTGAYTKEQLQQYHPDHIIDHLGELPSLIL